MAFNLSICVEIYVCGTVFGHAHDMVLKDKLIGVFT